MAVCVHGWKHEVWGALLRLFSAHLMHWWVSIHRAALGRFVNVADHFRSLPHRHLDWLVDFRNSFAKPLIVSLALTDSTRPSLYLYCFIYTNRWNGVSLIALYTRRWQWRSPFVFVVQLYLESWHGSTVTFRWTLDVVLRLPPPPISRVMQHSSANMTPVSALV